MTDDDHIAGAKGAGKLCFDLPAILRASHALAKQRRANNRAWRSYRQAFADALRREWHAAKMARAQAEIEAEDADPIELPEDVRAEAAALRLRASCLPFACTRSYRELNDEANAIEEAARAAMKLPAAADDNIIRVDWINHLAGHEPEPVRWGACLLPAMMRHAEFDRLTVFAMENVAPSPGPDAAPAMRQVFEFVFNRICRAQNWLAAEMRPEILEESNAMRELYDILFFLEAHAPTDLAASVNETDDPEDPNPGDHTPTPGFFAIP